MGTTNISYLDRTWSPIIGCTHSGMPGCDQCWARDLHTMRRTATLAGKRMPEQYGAPFDEIQLLDARMDEPLRWRKPQRVGVCFQSDWMHPDVPQWYIHELLHRMLVSPRHTFLTLTKRPERFGRLEWQCSTWQERYRKLPNVWLGVSVATQADADRLIPRLLEAPAAVRWLSIEPMLGPVDLRAKCPPEFQPYLREDRIGFVVVGCESGPRRRPCDPDWIKAVVEQCTEAGVPVYTKQLSIQGKVVTDIGQFPSWAQRREFPEVTR